ncbi:MAG TPA: S24 family peptidase [Allosphingosinicella sp.]|jgi:phage repressor protein C with HTH and peptisase S24 domain|nr:S24 family peptidase [Allosphingosinicella sp.]
MNAVDPRTALERLLRERGEDYAGLSRLIGKNPAYIQQFIKRGTPRKLDEQDRRTIARYLGVSEAVLGGPAAARGGDDQGDMVRVPRLDVGASAGHGAVADSEVPVAHIAFDPVWLRQLCKGGTNQLSFIRVQGDSMSPTLADGDDILVDGADGADRLRDGIYVLRREDMLMVKRLAINPFADRATISSDNPAYPEWRDVELATLAIIGRVVWAGRRLS